MAKSLRASGKKANRARLRDRVFGPVELARQERLSIRLLELARRPKPKAENSDETDETVNSGMFYLFATSFFWGHPLGVVLSCQMRLLMFSIGKNVSALTAADANTTTSTDHDRQGDELMELEGMEEGNAEGTYLAYPIPSSLSSVPSSPSTDREYSVDNSDVADTASASDDASLAEIAAEIGAADTAPFFTALGLSTAITGFSTSGDLVLCLDYPTLPPCLSPKRCP